MGQVMLRKSIAAAIALGVIACGATVGLEAVGLLFHASLPDPQQRIDAFVARLEADLSPVDLPTEPVEPPHEVVQQLPGGDAERAMAAVPVLAGDSPDSEGDAAESPRQAGLDGRSEERVAVAFSSPLTARRPESTAQSDDTVAPEGAVAPAPPEALESAPAPLPAVQVSSPAPAVAQIAPRATGARRARPELGPAGYAAFGWPVLDWLTLQTL